MADDTPVARARTKPCEHDRFQVGAAIAKLTHEDGGPVIGYSADIRIVCAECGLPFRFVGMAAGSHHSEPRVSVDGLQMRAPLEPATHERFVAAASYTMPSRAKN